MKKVLLTGAVLILLVMLAIDYNINHFLKIDQKNNSGTMAAVPASPASTGAVTNTDTNPERQYPAEKTAGSTVTIKRKHTHTKHVNVASVDESLPVAADVSQYVGMVVIMDGNETPEISAVSPKVYFGNMPVVKTQRNKFIFPQNILGVELGYSQNSLSNPHVSEIMTGSINVGLLVNLSFGDHFAVQTGMRYISKGNKLQDSEDIETKEKLSMHYLEVPANLVLKFGTIGDVRFMVGAGPYVSYMVGTKHTFQTSTFSDGSDVLPSAPEYAVNNINKFDWGMGGFIGLQSPDGIFAKVGGEVGMADLVKNADGSYSGRNSSIMISVGYLLGGK